MALEDQLEDEEEEAARDMAILCLVFGLQPSEYRQLTDVEREAFVDLANKQ